MSLLVSTASFAVSAGSQCAADSQITFSLTPLPGESPADFGRRLARQIKATDATPLHLLAFGNLSARDATLTALEKDFGHLDWPMTWVEGAACSRTPVAGAQVHAFTGNVERVLFRDRVVGSAFTDGGARQCWVGGLSPVDATLPRAEQTQRTLEELQTILASTGFVLADTVRTWFFLENILAWYDDFNRARTAVYSGIKFRTGSLPASTGVGAKNPAGSALALAALAVRPLAADVRAQEVASPLQCPAPAYGSSFSRAMIVPASGGGQLHISGTASIAPGGKTVWLGDVVKQVELTMEVVEAILLSRGLTLAALTRATAYFRHATDVGVFHRWLAENRLEQMPVVCAQCDVCRDDLLFELEAEAPAGRKLGG